MFSLLVKADDKYLHKPSKKLISAVLQMIHYWQNKTFMWDVVLTYVSFCGIPHTPWLKIYTRNCFLPLAVYAVAQLVDPKWAVTNRDVSATVEEVSTWGKARQLMSCDCYVTEFQQFIRTFYQIHNLQKVKQTNKKTQNHKKWRGIMTLCFLCRTRRSQTFILLSRLKVLDNEKIAHINKKNKNIQTVSVQTQISRRDTWGIRTLSLVYMCFLS